LYGALVSGLLRLLAPRRRSPAVLMQTLNETLLERKVDAQYATLLVALWEPRVRRLTLCNAGSEPPLIFHKGEVLRPKVEGVPIGLLEEREYEEVAVETEPGDVILFYSDGVEDQLNARDEEYSRSRTLRVLKKHGHEAPHSIARSLFLDLDEFRQDTPLTDDQSVVVMKVC
jgi:sigma-B regulation protein RsbU (phosphoserine phosphatase)